MVIQTNQGVTTKHPEMTADRLAEWQLVRDCQIGESAVKARGTAYLPMPSGFSTLGDSGAAAYSAYRERAQFPEIFAPSLAALVGIAHGKEVQIELPGGMEYLNETATADRLSLVAFHQRITRNLLWLGRFGVLADAPQAGGEPFLAGYAAETIINWDDEFYVLDESSYIRNGFSWDLVPRFRVLDMDGGIARQRTFTGKELAEAQIVVQAKGNKSLPRVPFVVASALDLTPKPETPPLIGVARVAKANYQLSADYRHQLYMSGQETLVAINGDAPTAVGAGVVHRMDGTDTQTPDLKYVSPSCIGIEAHKTAMADNREAAVMAGARLLEQSESVEESGSARQLRFASETATLQGILNISCGLLERSLRNIALMKGLDENAVVVTPPKDLMNNTLTPGDAASLMSVWQNGGISYQTFYEKLQAGGIASAERDFEDETALIDSEQPDDTTALTQPMAAQNKGNRADGSKNRS